MRKTSTRSGALLTLLLTIFIVTSGCSSAVAIVPSRGSSSGLAVPQIGSDGVVGAVGVQPNRTEQSNGSSHQHHVNPSQVKKKGKLSQLERWYSSRLAGRLQSSSIEINKGQYRKAHSLVGSKYDRMLSRYVNVTGQTDSNSDEKLAKELNETQQQQQTYVDSVQRYRRLHKQYRKAARNGNKRKARRLARTLNHLQSTVKTTDNELAKGYGTISKSSGKNLHREVHSIHKVTKNITGQQIEVRKNEFTKTKLTVISVQQHTSYHNPLTVSGVVRAKNGAPLANRTVRLSLTQNHSVSTETDENGTFSVSARPRAVRLGKQSFDVRYVPSNASVYLGANETVTSIVHQTKAKVSLERSRKTSRFGRPVVATGSVRAAGRNVSNVSILLFAGGKRVGTTTTNANGTFKFRSKLPFNISSGNRRLQVQLPFHRQALRRANATAPLRIRETPTSLRVNGTVTQGRNVSVRGTLTTKRGTNVSNQTLAVLANGKRIGTVSTGTNGTYNSRFPVPPNVTDGRSNGDVRLALRYHSGGTNLADTVARTTVVLPSDSTILGRFWLLVVLGGALVVLIGIVGAYMWRRRSAKRGTEPQQVEPSESQQVDETPSNADTLDAKDAYRQFIDGANTALTEGDPNRATELAYAAIRVYLETTTSVEPTLTLWEFYDACREDGLDPNNRSALETVTGAYERATFTGEPISEDAAHDAVRKAGQFGESDV